MRKVRDFGQVISDSFLFITSQAKPFFKIVLLISGVFILATWASSSVYQVKVLQLYGNMQSVSNVNQQIYGIPYLILVMASMLSVLAITLATLSYLKAYDENNGITPNDGEVWHIFKSLFFKYLIANILFTILIGIAFMLCLVPGIYLFPVISILYPILVFEGLGLGSLLSRGFYLVKENWWKLFGTLILITMVAYMCAFIFGLPTFLLTMFGVFFSSTGPLANGLAILFSLFNALGQIAWAFASVAIALCYFSLREEKEGAGLLQKIERFAADGPASDNDLPQEEY